MQESCHRCGGTLPEGSGESPFCPHCGTPQLFLSLENQSAETGGELASVAAGGASTGALPPPRPRQVEWKTAIRCAAAVAGIAAVLSLGAMRLDLLVPLSFLWVMSGSMITLGLYQMQQPAAWMDVRVGARIGVVVGMCVALGLGIALAGAGLVRRFVLHSMGNFDAQWATDVQNVIRQSASQLPPEGVKLMYSPEFHAGVMLAGFGFVAACLLLYSALFGAFAGLLRMRRRPVV